MGDTTNLSSIKPDDFGVEKNKDWYMQYARYVGSKYNHVIPRFYPNTNNDQLSRPERWAARVMRLFSYVFAEQDNSLYDYMAIDENNNPLPTKLLNTHVIDTLVKHMEGTMQSNISSLPDTIFARALDSDYLKYKKSVENLAKMKMEFDDIFKELQNEGMDFLPTGNQQFKDEETLRKYIEETLQNAMEKYFTAWAKDWLYKTDYMNWVKQLFRYCIPSYFARTELYTENGQVKIKIHKPQYCVWDNGYDDEFGRKQRYQGIIDEFTIPQLKAAYPELTSDELKELNAEAQQNNNYNNNNANNMSLAYTDSIIWYNNDNNLPTITTLKARWVSIGDDGEPTWYKGDLIANKYILRYGLCDNLTKNSQGYLNPPFIDFIPEMISGKNRSPVDRAMDLADKVKGYEGKIDLLVNRIKGNVVTLFADKFPEGADSLTIAEDIANGLITLEGVNIDDSNPAEKRNFLFKVENIGIDYNSYRALSEKVDKAHNEIRDIFSIPRISLGTQQGVLGKGVQEQTIQQATFGVMPFYDGFTQYINNVIHAACEMRKNLITITDNPDNVEEILQITRREFNIFKLAKKWSLHDLNIYLDTKDAITEEQRRYLMSIFERDSQVPNSFVDSLVVAEALMCQTNTELVNLLRYKKAIFEEKQAIIRQQEAEQAMAQQQMAMEAQENMAVIQGQSKIANTVAKGNIDIQSQALAADIAEDNNEELPTV